MASKPPSRLEGLARHDPTVLPTLRAQWNATQRVDDAMERMAPHIVNAITAQIKRTDDGVPYLDNAGKLAAMAQIRQIIAKEEPTLVNAFMIAAEQVAAAVGMDTGGTP